MTVPTIKLVINRFLSQKDTGVIALKGAWGVGKTFAWNKIITESKTLIQPPNYSYVSLFGVRSLSELRIAIFANTEALDAPDDDGAARSNKNYWVRLGTKLGRLVTQKTGALREIPALKNLSIGLDAIAPYLITNTVICLDDFERMADGVHVDELLGFVSALKEEKGCKIIFIFNEDQLGEKGLTYKKYREKLIDIELLFSPTVSEAIEIALPENLTGRDLIAQNVITLGIKNIRVLRKIAELSELIANQVKELHKGVMQRVIPSVVLLVWVCLDWNEKKPTVQFIRNWNTLMFKIKEKENDGGDLQQKEWASILRSYGFTHVDELDLAICEVIERGYVEETGLIEAAKATDAMLRANDLEGSFAAAWRLFHNTFADNEAELVNAIENSFRKSAAQITPLNLNGTVKLLRSLKHSALADELIDYYMVARKADTTLFDLESYPFSSDITDTRIRSLFDQEWTGQQMLPSLLDVIKGVAKNNGWGNIEIQVLRQATENDFYSLFKQDHGEGLGQVIRTCLKFQGYNGYQDIGLKAQAALERIGKESQLNAERVLRYGIDIRAILLKRLITILRRVASKGP